MSQTRRPVIGLTTYLEQTRWLVWDTPAAVLHQVYLDAVVRAGGIPVLLPPTGIDARPALDLLDGLMLVGGADLDPANYGQPPHPETKVTRPARDTDEIRLVLDALRRDLPVLGVCRGAQILNVALGGTLHQHLPDQVGHSGHLPEPGVFGSTPVRTEPGSLVAQILGAEATVPCHHHQVLDRVADGLRPTAWAGDGAVEAVEHAGTGWVLGVQWHPEQDASDRRLFEAHVLAAGQRDGLR